MAEYDTLVQLAGVCQREKYIPAQLNRLEKVLAALQEKVDTLEEKLAPVLNTDMANKERGEESTSEKPQLALKLETLADKFTTILERVNSIEARLEI